MRSFIRGSLNLVQMRQFQIASTLQINKKLEFLILYQLQRKIKHLFYYLTKGNKGSNEHILNDLNPLDGRYEKSITGLKEYFSEKALIKYLHIDCLQSQTLIYRIDVEIEWLQFLVQKNMIKNERGETIKISPLDLGPQKFDIEGAKRVKEIESTTNHDVKAVEYYIKEQLEKIPVFKEVKEYVHFCCTSEDINNLSYSLMLSDAKNKILLKTLEDLQTNLTQVAENNASVPMLSRTHGQVASPTTVGKEIANFTYRANRQIQNIKKHKFSAKLNGAVGNFNAHMFAYPEYQWSELSKQFIESLGLEFNPYTTQIEPHDSLAEFYNFLSLLNTIYIGFSRDMWNYISIGYFKQKTKKNEVGSSTMPHKVNPIDYENCEGNLGMANSVMKHFSEKLPISRYQRDLSDSTVMRNHGIAFGYSVVGYKSLLKGLDKIEVNNQKLQEDLNSHWEVLAEPIQTVMRKYGMQNPYELLKDMTRGKSVVEKEDLQKLIKQLQLPADQKQKLLDLTPSTYIGNAEEMSHVKKYIK